MVFYINKTILADHYTIRSNDGKYAFYASFQFCGLALREGLDKKSPIVAVSSLPFLSRKVMVGLGDPADAQAMRWEHMEKTGFIASRHHWAMVLSEDEKSSARIYLVWSRMRPRNYALQEAHTGEVLAIFTSDITTRTCGVLQVNRSYGRDFDLMLLATFLSLYDSAKRKTRVIWERD